MKNDWIAVACTTVPDTNECLSGRRVLTLAKPTCKRARFEERVS